VAGGRSPWATINRVGALVVVTRPAPALTHPGNYFCRPPLSRGARPAGRRSIVSLYISIARARGGARAVARGKFFQKPGSQTAPYHIFFTFIDISTVNFELGNGLPREFWA
jgi:hypothetical protein